MFERLRSICRKAVLLGLLLLCARFPALADPGTGISVPFEFIRHEVVVQARIDGQGPFAMLLDTGTAPSVIDLNVARRIGLSLDSTGHSGSGGGAGTSLAYETSLPAVDIGRFSAANVSALAMDLSGLSGKFGQPIQGVLGDSLFSDRVVQFDYPHRTARFFERSSDIVYAHPSHLGAVVLPFRHEDDEVHLSGVRVNGRLVRANLDTGSNGTFALTPTAIRRLGLEASVARAKTNHAAGFNGAYGSRVGTVHSIQVGPITRLVPPVTFWLPGTGHDRPWDVNIGNVFLQDFVVTIDYRADTVTLDRP